MTVWYLSQTQGSGGAGGQGRKNRCLMGFFSPAPPLPCSPAVMTEASQ